MYSQKNIIHIIFVILYLITTGFCVAGCSNANTIYRGMPDDFSLDMVVLTPTKPSSAFNTVPATPSYNYYSNQRFIVESDGSLRVGIGDTILRNVMPNNIRRLSLDQMYELWQLYKNIELQMTSEGSTRLTISPSLFKEEMPVTGSAFILWGRAYSKARCLRYNSSESTQDNSDTKTTNNDNNPFLNLLQKLAEFSWLDNRNPTQ